MLFEDVGRGVWSSVVYCGCIPSGLILSGWGISPFFPSLIHNIHCVCLCVCVCVCVCVCAVYFEFRLMSLPLNHGLELT